MTAGDLPLSARAVARLRVHVDLLIRWNQAINLVSASTLPDAWSRHVVDSAQLVTHAPGRIGHWADLGSGAGFPGLVVAAVLADEQPEAKVTLIESDRRKATFLREAARAMDLVVNVRPERIEVAAPLGADVVSARALAPLDTLIPLARRHLGPDGICLFLKGAQVDDELASAGLTWSFSVERLASVTDTTAEILRMKGLTHA